MEPGDSNFDWNGEEGKQATVRLNRFLEHIDKTSAPEGLVRSVVTIGTTDDGQPLRIICWRKQ